MSNENSHDEPRVVINDKRRIDPTTGKPRGGGFGGFASSGSRSTGSPFAEAADPADSAQAEQPISATPAPSAELEVAQQESAERLADLQRVTAEYANYRKRVDRDREQVVEGAKARVITELLTVLDDIDRADRHGDLTGAFKAVADRLTSTLERLGLTQFAAVGDEFDPVKHEAVQFSTAADVAVQTVSTVMRHGYTIGEKLVRPAVVGVVGPEHEAEPIDAELIDADIVESEVIDEGSESAD